MATAKPWVAPIFFMKEGATLDYTWNWGDWLMSVSDTIDSFDFDCGDGLTFVASSQSGDNLSGWFTATPVDRRTRASAWCRIVTSGVGGVNPRTEIRDITIVINPLSPDPA